MDLTVVWAIVIALAVLLYVVLDGFDLGIGILFPFAPGHAERDTMMNSVAPVWDGNETWLVLGGTGLFAAFPLAYSVLLPALYLPLIVMLIALIFRGVSFEFRFRAERSRWLWDVSFAGGSTLATLAQGIVLGAFIQGFSVRDAAFAGGPFDWLTPFSIMTGVALVSGYALLGATWLHMKTVGDLKRWAGRMAVRLMLVVLCFIAAVSLWTPLAEPEIAARWFTWSNLLYLWPVPLVTAAVGLALWRSLAAGRDVAPFPLAIALFALSYLGLGISLWPYAVPRALTIWQAASGRSTQLFLLVGVLILLPVILGYTVYVYRVFRGKVTGEEGYH